MLLLLLLLVLQSVALVACRDPAHDLQQQQELPADDPNLARERQLRGGGGGRGGGSSSRSSFSSSRSSFSSSRSSSSLYRSTPVSSSRYRSSPGSSSLYSSPTTPATSSSTTSRGSDPVTPESRSSIAAGYFLGSRKAYAKEGFTSTPLYIWAPELIASSAKVTHVSRNLTCDGTTVKCYRDACERTMLALCQAAFAASALRGMLANTITETPGVSGASNMLSSTLLLSPCPLVLGSGLNNSKYSECYRTATFNSTTAASFECFGARQPALAPSGPIHLGFQHSPVLAVCHKPDRPSPSGVTYPQRSTAGAASGRKVRST